MRARVIERATGAAVGEIEAETSYGLWTALLDWAERRGTPRFRALAHYRTEREQDASAPSPSALPAPTTPGKTHPAARRARSPRPSSPAAPGGEPDGAVQAPAAPPLMATPPEELHAGATVGQPIEAPSPAPAPPTPPDVTTAVTAPTGAQPWLMPPDPGPTGDEAEAALPGRPARRRRPRRPTDPDGPPTAEQLRLF